MLEHLVRVIKAGDYPGFLVVGFFIITIANFVMLLILLRRKAKEGKKKREKEKIYGL